MTNANSNNQSLVPNILPNDELKNLLDAKQLGNMLIELPHERLLELGRGRAFERFQFDGDRAVPPRINPRGDLAMGHEAERQEGINFEDEHDKPQPKPKPDFYSILRDQKTAEELLKLAQKDGLVSERELDEVALDAKNEGKTLSYTKSDNDVKDKDGNVTFEGQVEIKNGDKSTKLDVNFETGVPMSSLPRPAPSQTPAAPDR